jgi:hypothetical protein
VPLSSVIKTSVLATDFTAVGRRFSSAPVRSVRNLGIHIDADLIMRTHVIRTVSRCFAVLRQLRQVRRPVPSGTFQTLISALILARLIYANNVLVGQQAYLVQRLQSVLVHRRLLGAALEYLGPLRRVADVPGRRSLQSASMSQLVVPFIRLAVGARLLPVSGPSVCNSLPADIISIDSFPAFQCHLKTVLFWQSYIVLIPF